MESIVDECSAPVTGAGPVALSAASWDEVRLRVDNYLRAWRLPESWRRELVSEIMLTARSHAMNDAQSDLTRVAVQEAERRLAARLNESLMGALGSEDGITAQQRLALVCSALPAKWCVADPTSLRAAYLRGVTDAEPALHPKRSRETHLTTMETSLSRLPSFRMIAGWFALVALIVLVFILTH